MKGLRCTRGVDETKEGDGGGCDNHTTRKLAPLPESVPHDVKDAKTILCTFVDLYDSAVRLLFRSIVYMVFYV